LNFQHPSLLSGAVRSGRITTAQPIATTFKSWIIAIVQKTEGFNPRFPMLRQMKHPPSLGAKELTKYLAFSYISSVPALQPSIAGGKARDFCSAPHFA
jgi:hypothetical protein